MLLLDAVVEFCEMVEDAEVLTPEILEPLLVLSVLYDVVLVKVDPSTTTADEVA